MPSKSNLIASKISLCIFDTSNTQALHQGSGKSDTSRAQAVHPYNKHNINIINNETSREQNSQNVNQILNSENKKTKKSKRKKTGPGAEKICCGHRSIK